MEGFANSRNSEFSVKGRWKDESFCVVNGSIDCTGSIEWNAELEVMCQYKLLARNFKFGDSCGIRVVGGETSLKEDAQVLIGTREMPLLARRRVQSGWVYCINSDARSTPHILVENLIK